MKTSLTFALFLTLWLGGLGQRTNVKSVQQRNTFHSLNVGDNVTLRCSYEGAGMTFYWYKQTLGQEPRVMSVFYQNKDGNFYDNFKNDRRFKQYAHGGTCNLTISNLALSDSATYYCVGSNFYDFEFGGGTTVAVKDLDLDNRALVYQSPHEPGSSLQCTVHRGTCDEDHTVYWFRDSEEPESGVFYTPRGGGDHCERNLVSHQNHSCVYNLSVENLKPHSGIYYCAVASCGQILFGNGTKLNSGQSVGVNVLVCILTGALIVTTTLVFFLLHLTCKMRRTNCQCSASPGVSPSQPSPDTEFQMDRVEDNLNYAAFMGNRFNSLRRTTNSDKSECVYSRVK